MRKLYDILEKLCGFSGISVRFESKRVFRNDVRLWSSVYVSLRSNPMDRFKSSGDVLAISLRFFILTNNKSRNSNYIQFTVLLKKRFRNFLKGVKYRQFLAFQGLRKTCIKTIIWASLGLKLKEKQTLMIWLRYLIVFNRNCHFMFCEKM